MKKKLVLIGIMILSVLILIFGYLFVESLFMPFNSEGNYLDESTMTVYHQQQKEVYGIITFSLFILVITLVNFIREKE
jgi:hypothetical protein